MNNDFQCLNIMLGGVITDVLRNGIPEPESGTIEKIGYQFDLTIQEHRGNKKHTRELLESMRDIVGLYETVMGLNFEEKAEQEQYHYDMLRAGIIHTARATEYFFDQGPEISRKNIFFSNDCISSIQIVARSYEILMMVHFRSSDAINLLPVDIHALLQIFNTYLQVHKIDVGNKRVGIQCTFGSIHILNKDLE